ncbi:choice-of-anchor J domain-containing protein [Flavobacterium sp.]|uniref:T9SS-dependent choice-of-anchor J family protein n=1 Tax=Flavobacterium sp. TaxID=239 RepID=UPI00262E92B6|nr:choice-of-anchor J domain-containing protein [Flavobacterium sp.]
MRKITLLLLFLLGFAVNSHSQCLQPDQYPNSIVVSNNLGTVQEIATCNYTLEYSVISNIQIGSDYIFTCTVLNDVTEKYVTVTDMSDNLIAEGPSPLTVSAITADEIKVNYSDDASCAGIDSCHLTTLQLVLACPFPLNASVSNITTTSADFTWEAGGSETAWEVLLLPEGAPAPTAATSGTAVASPTFTANGLTQSEGYEFYVRANCGSDFSPWTLALPFNAACDPIGSFYENFDTATTPDLPTCWTALLRGAGLSQYAAIQTETFEVVHSSPNSVNMYNSDSTGDYDVILVSPSLSNLGAGTHRVKFWASGFSDLQIGTLDGFSSTATFNVLEEIAVTDTPTQYTVDFTSYTGADTYIGIRMNTTNTYSNLYIDDILWEVSPTCPDVTEVTVPVVGTDSATVNWVGSGTETAWQVAVGGANETNPNSLTPTPATSESAVVNGLTDNTVYNVWVRSMCAGGTDPGAWIGPVRFKTACLPVANFFEDFDSVTTPNLPDCWSTILRGPTVSDFARISTSTFNATQSAPNSVELYNSSSDTAGSDDIILVSPNLSTVGTGTHRLKFYAKNAGSLQLGTLDTNTNDAVFSLIEEVATTDQLTQYTVDFTSYSGADTYVAIRMNNSSTYTTVVLDNILWEVSPTCSDVTDVAVVATTTDGASVTWTGSGSENSWNIAVGAATVTDPSTLTFTTASSESAEIAGLTDNTNYRVWVRSVCAGNDNGAWIGPVPFKTACLPTANFTENFDTTATDTLPDCWSAILRGPTVSQYASVDVVNFQTVQSAPNSVQLYNSSSDTAGADDIILVSPNVSTLSLGTYRLKFFASGQGSLQIGTLDSNTNAAVFSMIEEIATTDTVTEYKIDFTSYTGSDTYVAIRMNNSAQYTSLFIDNVTWEISPTCPDVTEIAVEGVTTTTADVVWTSNGSETQWQVAYAPAPSTDPTTATIVSATTVSASLSGLTPATKYNLWVRSVCSGGTDPGAWIGPVTFNTLCLPVGLPYIEDFESATVPGLPLCGSVVNLGDGNEWIVTEDTFGANNAGFNSKTLTYNYDFASPADTWFFTGGITLQANVDYQISYRYGDNADDNYSEDLKVMAGTAQSADEMFIDIADYTGINSGAAINELVSFTVPTNGVYYFGFNAHSAANQYFIYVDDIMVDTALSTGGVTNDRFNYYPNPVKDYLNLTNTKNISSVTVYNLLGQRVLENDVNANNAKIDMSALSAGNYIVKVTADGMTKSIKVVKQ